MLAEKFGAGIAFSAFFLLQLAPQAPLTPDPPKQCASCAGWNADHAPSKIYGNTYFVGTAGLGAVLVTSATGHILLDAGLPESAALIDAHIRQLGFRTADIKLILTSHAHYDHVGGVAALQRYTGAIVAASPSTADALRRGRPTDDDPQFLIPDNTFPVVSRVETVRDGEVLRAGELSATAHFTPGHTPGSTTWTWQSCEAGKCLSMVYADSLNAVSADGFRFSGDAKTASRVDAFRKSINTVDSLPCDALITVHPSFSKPFVDPGACHAYAATAKKTLEERLAKER